MNGINTRAGRLGATLLAVLTLTLAAPAHGQPVVTEGNDNPSQPADDDDRAPVPDAQPSADGDSPAAPDNDRAGAVSDATDIGNRVSSDASARPTPAPGPAQPTGAGAPPAAAEALAGGPPPSLIEDDVAPTIDIYTGEGTRLRMGGLVQVHLAPFVGGDALVSNDDIATSEGFRLRRARLGVEALFGDEVSVLLVVNPLESDSEVGTVSDALLVVQFLPGHTLSVGTGKVPLGRANLESSRSLQSIERPLSVRTISPDRRLGAIAEGAFLGRRLAYLVAVMNATEGYERGNQFGGLLYSGRLQVAAWGQPDLAQPERDGLAIGVSTMLEDGPATRTLGGAIDILLAIARASVKLEVMCDRTTPQDDPITSPMVADDVDRCGAYAEAAYTLPQWQLQPVIRVETFDDDRSLDDAGDVILLSVGVNARLYRKTRVQLHYLGRFERFGEERSNDSVVVNLQGEF